MRKNKKGCGKQHGNRHSNSQSQPLHAHRTAGKDYHERIVTIQGGVTINVNIGDKHEDSKTLITDLTQGLQVAMAGMTDVDTLEADRADTAQAEAWEEAEGPTQKAMADYVAPRHDKATVLAVLHRAIDGRSGVDVPRILMVACQQGLLTKMPSYEMARREFGQIGVQSGYYRGKSTRLTNEEISEYTKLLER